MKAYCEKCGKRWYYWQGGVTIMQTGKKRMRYHKMCYETDRTRWWLSQSMVKAQAGVGEANIMQTLKILS